MRMLVLLLASTSILAAGCSSDQKAASTAPATGQTTTVTGTPAVPTGPVATGPTTTGTGITMGTPATTGGALPAGGLVSAAVLSSPADVRTVQNRLKQLQFFGGDPSGAWNTDTELAVQNFQRANSLPVGRLDQATLRTMGLSSIAMGNGRLTDVAMARGPGMMGQGMMGQGMAGQPPMQHGMGPMHGDRPMAGMAPAAGPGPGAHMMGRQLTPASARDVQQKLADGGFYQIKVDGIWGPRSQDALLEFQRARSLTANGALTPETVSALGLEPNALQWRTRPARMMRR